MPPLKGSFWVLVLYDVAEQIQLDKLRSIVGAEPPRREPSFKHPAPEYVRFERPPVVEYPDAVCLSTGERFQCRIKYFDYGVTSVELELSFEADWSDLVRLEPLDRRAGNREMHGRVDPHSSRTRPARADSTV